MHESAVRPYAEAHGRAILTGDLEHALADLTQEVRDNLIALPEPLTSSEVMSIKAADDESVVAHIRYTGGDAEEVTVRSVWKQLGGRPMIVEATLA